MCKHNARRISVDVGCSFCKVTKQRRSKKSVQSELERLNVNFHVQITTSCEGVIFF